MVPIYLASWVTSNYIKSIVQSSGYCDLGLLLMKNKTGITRVLAYLSDPLIITVLRHLHVP